MNNRGIEGPGLLKTLISFAIVFAIAMIILFYTTDLFAAQENKQAIETWVNARTATAGTNAVFSEQPPVIDLQEPLQITKEDLISNGNNVPKAFPEIANSMVDCWSAFENGEKDFINEVQKEKFCFPCRAIQFSDDIKKDKTQIKGLNKYLFTEKTSNGKTYMQILNNDPELQAESSDLENDVILADKDLYIMFFAASGRGTINLISNVLFQDDLVPDETRKGFSSDESFEPIAKYEGISGSEKAELGAVAAGTGLANNYLIPKLAEQISQEAAKTAVKETTTKIVEEAVLEKASGNLIFKTTTEITEKLGTQATEKIIAKSLGRTIAKKGASVGLRFVSRAAGWPLAIAGAGYGIYQVVNGVKPYTAQIMLIDSDKVSTICNE